MQNYTLIWKFIGASPPNWDLVMWIKDKWKTKVYIHLNIGAKHFIMMIFMNLEDFSRVFENGPYFLKNACLFIQFWMHCFNWDKEKILASPIWVILYPISIKYWKEDILVKIGNTIGNYVKSSEINKSKRCITYARICMYINVSEPLLESIFIFPHDEDIMQPIRYEHINFFVEGAMNMATSTRNSPLQIPPSQRI